MKFNCFLFPLDMVYLTYDSWHILLDMSAFHSSRPDGSQPCVFCRRQDYGYAPRPIPPGLLKYHCRWVGCMLQPCVHDAPAWPFSSRCGCLQDGVFIRYSRWIPLLALFLAGVWGVLIALLVRLIFFGS
ncbi:MAG: hypothetical protein LAT83_14755 [Kiritimatiellae bacterium]|nr:hypothetical protein [Kiritimatiellia bacterium]